MSPKVFIFLLFFNIFLEANETSSSLTRQKIEVLELKNELNNFYNEKEKEYQERKKELEDTLAKIEEQKKEIEVLYKKNDDLLKDIRAEIKKKTIIIFERMKAKNAAEIFDQMILEGKIEDVFDIIVRLKETNVSTIMKFLNVQNSSILVQKLERYNKDKDERN